MLKTSKAKTSQSRRQMVWTCLDTTCPAFACLYGCSQTVESCCRSAGTAQVHGAWYVHMHHQEFVIPPSHGSCDEGHDERRTQTQSQQLAIRNQPHRRCRSHCSRSPSFGDLIRSKVTSENQKSKIFQL